MYLHAKNEMSTVGQGFQKLRDQKTKQDRDMQTDVTENINMLKLCVVTTTTNKKQLTMCRVSSNHWQNTAFRTAPS